MFSDNELYDTKNPELLKLARPQTLARWRFERRGPKFIKAGSRVLYHGQALNEWLQKRTIETRDA